jgi:hypothetical protein
VTSLAEYNSGTRATVANSDRLQETTIPVVTEGIRSMVKGGYDVDLFLVCHYTLKPEREALVRAALPPNVGLEVWNEATPLGYITDKEPFTKLVNRTEHLARQHRFVIKDKVPYYDIFVNFEDDMLITAEHVRHFEAMTEEIARLRDAAPDDPPPNVRSSSDALNSYHGTMTKSQLKRTIPGFIRVEVLLDEEHYPAQSNTGPVPIDLEFGGGRREEVDAAVCCHVSSKTVSEHRPANPKSDQLMLWETHILPLGVRRMPDQSWLDWVVTQRGPNQNKLDKKEIIGDYWTNRKRKFYPKESRPASQEFKFINNQGGWVRLDFCYCCTILTVPASHVFFVTRWQPGSKCSCGTRKSVRGASSRRTRLRTTASTGWTCGTWNGTAARCSSPPCDTRATCSGSFCSIRRTSPSPSSTTRQTTSRGSLPKRGSRKDLPRPTLSWGSSTRSGSRRWQTLRINDTIGQTDDPRHWLQSHGHSAPYGAIVTFGGAHIARTTTRILNSNSRDYKSLVISREGSIIERRRVFSVEVPSVAVRRESASLRRTVTSLTRWPCASRHSYSRPSTTPFNNGSFDTTDA